MNNNYPLEIWADTDLVCSEEPLAGWQKYRRVDEPEKTAATIKIELEMSPVIHLTEKDARELFTEALYYVRKEVPSAGITVPLPPVLNRLRQAMEERFGYRPDLAAHFMKPV